MKRLEKWTKLARSLGKCCKHYEVFRENSEGTFSEFWRNSLKITKENEKVAKN